MKDADSLRKETVATDYCRLAANADGERLIADADGGERRDC